MQTLVTASSGSDAEPARRRLDAAAAADTTTSAWIGLRFSDHDEPDKAKEETPDRSEWWTWLLALGGALALHVQVVSDLLDDPVTGLPDRAEFQAHLRQALYLAKSSQMPLSLLLVNPEDFTSVNERHGRDTGDAVLREIAGKLLDALRDVDLVAKYGGAVFAVILHGTAPAQAEAVAFKVLDRLSNQSYADGALRLRFSIGVSGFEPQHGRDEQPLSLMRMADQALRSAKRAGGGEIVHWKPGTDIEDAGGMDRLSGIFTASMAKDYRNMVLLWDTVTVVATHADFDTLAANVTERLFTTFKPDEVGLFRWTEEGSLSLVHGLTRGSDDSTAPAQTRAMVLTADQRLVMEEARAQARPLQSSLPSEPDDPDAKNRAFYAVPLIVEDHCLGSLFILGREDELGLDTSDLIFLRALGGQLALALDRARLAEQERRRLQGELRQLRSALRHSKLVYRSEKMESVLALVRRVAPTDATVLITGESGTGKELMAATIHELSRRRKARMEVVDCATIAPTLIESELFGHEAGAYTGAERRKEGRLALADGGTVVLDEIGELPLEVQGRLLRFVQERQLTPVGGTRSRNVDVRVIAATNRDLAEEVAQGRFREDLFYRLNVIRVVLPPLRERPEDVLFLANHFLKTFAVQYQRPAQGLTPEAEAQITAYSWPGNIRELSNRIMQATILCEQDELGVEDLGLDREPGELPEPPPPQTIELHAISMATARKARGVASPPDESPDASWQRLRGVLGRQVEQAWEGHETEELGNYLDEDFVLAAYEAAGEVSARAAKTLGIPETTFRRKLQKASRASGRREASRPESWSEVRDLVAALVRAKSPGADNLLEQARSVLLEEVAARFPAKEATAAAFMGVSTPTYRRWLSRQVAVVK